MISRAKRLQLPTFRAMLTDLGAISSRQIGAALGVHHSTIERYRRTDRAPRPVLMALFWLTSWGQSELSCDLHNRATAATAHMESLRRENDALRRELARVLSAADFGSANRPTFQAPVTGPRTRSRH